LGARPAVPNIPFKTKERATALFAKAKEKNSTDIAPKNPNQAILTVGNDDFPLRIPIVKQKGKWVFDTKTGREEILNRRVGTNELDAIGICRGFVEAQEEYARGKPSRAWTDIIRTRLGNRLRISGRKRRSKVSRMTSLSWAWTKPEPDQRGDRNSAFAAVKCLTTALHNRGSARSK
jgi:hypothetical protein